MQLIIPSFWKKKRSLIAFLFLPFSFFYYLVNLINFWVKSRDIYISKAKIITVGNINIGGVGKTPVCLSIAKIIKNNNANMKLAILTRGYKGSEEGPIMVSPFGDVKKFGDEALLLAQNVPACVAKNRLEGIKFLEKLGFKIIITDDGLQDPRFKKDLSILVIDGEFGLGNNWIFPAGPLRESFASGIEKADLCVCIGKCEIPIEREKLLLANIESKVSLRNKNFIAFAGIGNPNKFFNSIVQSGGVIVAKFEFGDHYNFKDQELEKLISLAKEKKADLITTEKDYTRIKEKYRAYVRTLPIAVKWQKEKRLEKYLQYL